MSNENLNVVTEPVQNTDMLDVEKDVHNEQLLDINPNVETEESVNTEMEPIPADDMDDVDSYMKEMEAKGASMLNSDSKLVKATNRQKKRAFNVYDGEVYIPEGHYQIETDDEKKEKTYLELVSSKKSGKVLEGTIIGTEIYGNIGQVIAIVQYKEFNVIIPATELMWLAQNKHMDEEGLEELHRWVKMRIGSEVSFIVTDVDLKQSRAIASSIKAMGIKAYAYFVKKLQDTGMPRLYKGVITAGKVVCATSSFIIVESYGAEFMIREKELFYHRQDMVNNFYKVGDTVIYKVLDVEAKVEPRINGDKYKRVIVTGSVRQSKPNPADTYYDKYRIGQSQSARVTHIDENGVYCLMGTAEYPTMQILCRLPVTSDLPDIGQQVTVTITQKDDEKKFIYGVLSPIGKGRV